MADVSSGAWLSPAQKKIVGTGVTVIALGVIILFAYGVFLLTRGFVVQFQHVLFPLAIAGILATLLQPLVDFFNQRLKLSRNASIVLLFLFVFGVFALLLVYAIPILFQQLLGFLDFLPRFAGQILQTLEEQMPWAVSWLNERLEGESLQGNIESLINGNGDSLKAAALQILGTLEATGNILFGLVGLAAAYAVIPVYLFYLLKRQNSGWELVEGQLTFLRSGLREDILFLGRKFVDLLVSFFRGQILIGLLMAVLFVIGFWAIGLKFAVLFGVLIGLANIVPYLGTILGISLVFPVALFQEEGGWVQVGLAALVFMAVQAISDYVFMPWIMGDKTGMGPMLIIFSIFFWGTALGGILGMILAIPLTAFFLVFWLLLRDKYLPQWKEQGSGLE